MLLRNRRYFRLCNDFHRLMHSVYIHMCSKFEAGNCNIQKVMGKKAGKQRIVMILTKYLICILMLYSQYACTLWHISIKNWCLYKVIKTRTLMTDGVCIPFTKSAKWSTPYNPHMLSFEGFPETPRGFHLGSHETSPGGLFGGFIFGVMFCGVLFLVISCDHPCVFKTFMKPHLAVSFWASTTPRGFH